MSFYTKYLNLTNMYNSFVCVGLDSDMHKLPKSVMKERNPALVFNKRIIDETCEHCGCYKLNFAFYLAQGVAGIEAIRETINYIPNAIPTIIDIKAGDIGNTMEQYSTGVYHYFDADAMTINILMGSDVVDACLKRNESFAFALAITSNNSAQDYFYHDDLYKKFAKYIAQAGEEKLGAVVGATRVEDLATMRNLMPKTIFLIPGVGAQGGDLQAVCKHARASSENPLFLINSSRGIIFADDSENFAKTAGKETLKLKELINNNL